MAVLHPPETEYLCERTVMMKKAKTKEISSPTSRPRKIAEENVTIQTTLWERVEGRETVKMSRWRGASLSQKTWPSRLSGCSLIHS